MIRLTIVLVVLFLLIIPLSKILAETEVSGEVSGVWDADGSPFIVVDSRSTT